MYVIVVVVFADGSGNEASDGDCDSVLLVVMIKVMVVVCCECCCCSLLLFLVVVLVVVVVAVVDSDGVSKLVVMVYSWCSAG